MVYGPGIRIIIAVFVDPTALFHKVPRSEPTEDGTYAQGWYVNIGARCDLAIQSVKKGNISLAKEPGRPERYVVGVDDFARRANNPFPDWKF